MDSEFSVDESKRKFLTKRLVFGLITTSLLGSIIVFILEYFFIYQNANETLNNSFRFFIITLTINFLYQFYQYKRVINEDK